ncbi:MAG: hypothetical protein MK135_10990 [Polyangiaceae bacterium]|nr:hypothetical protein [Polyangiaceae bacterium]
MIEKRGHFSGRTYLFTLAMGSVVLIISACGDDEPEDGSGTSDGMSAAGATGSPGGNVEEERQGQASAQQGTLPNDIDPVTGDEQQPEELNDACGGGTFGEDCQPCQPCVHGRCDAGLEGTGTCSCLAGWSGEACDQLDTVKVVLSDTSACSLDTQGKIRCWGVGLQGELGNSFQTSETELQLESTNSTWIDLTASSDDYCAVRDDNTVHCWGYPFDEEVLGTEVTASPLPLQSQPATPTYKISTSDEVHCSLAEDGSASCWGDNSEGQVGVGTTFGEFNQPRSVVGNIKFTQLSVGDSATCGISLDRRLFCWGDNDDGQLGNPTLGQEEVGTPRQVGASQDWEYITGSSQNRAFCGIKSDRSLWCWGSNDGGMLGLNSPVGSVDRPTEVAAGTAWATVKLGAQHACGIQDDGSAWCWGSTLSGKTGVGPTEQESLGEPTQVGTSLNWVDLTMNSSTTLLINSSGAVYGFGENADGQLRQGSPWNDGYLEADVLPEEFNQLQLESQDSIYCGLTSESRVRCWGNYSGSASFLVDPRLQSLPRNIETPAFEQFAVGRDSICGLTNQGKVFCGGTDYEGALGQGVDRNEDLPFTEESSKAGDWIAIASNGRSTTCGLRQNLAGTETTLWCWGDGSSGLLGNGGEESSNSPQQEATGSTDWAAISAGTYHICGLKTDGKAWCFGDNSLGALGRSGDATTPAAEASATNWSQLAAGSRSTCAIRSSDQSLWCWGSNENGQLGTGTRDFNSHSSPTQIGSATNWSTVKSTGTHSCALNALSELWCWGESDFGQLGQVVDLSAPTKLSVNEDRDWTNFWVRSNNTFAKDSNGTITVWGVDYNGERHGSFPGASTCFSS